MQSLQDLIRQQKQINLKIANLVGNSYNKYGMSEIVKNDNPYSRLMALKKMGVVENYQKIKEKSVLVVGVGGVGSVTCEMLTRCGIGKLIIYDYDKVELANMNRLFFTPMQVGLSKVNAAKETLNLINPQIKIQAYNINVTTIDGYDHIVDRILHGSLNNERIDLVMSCVDNYAARITINTICNRLSQVWFESGVSEDALSSHIQIMVPGQTGCFVCASPLAVTQNTQATIKREGVCAASLPTTMGITAGFLVQNALKYLLNFGEVSFCLTYNARIDFFSNYLIKVNPECRQPSCQQIQRKKKEKQNQEIGYVKSVFLARQEKKKKKIQITHASNQWGIEVVTQEPDVNPVQQKKIQQKKQVTISIEQSKQSVEELMAKFNNL